MQPTTYYARHKDRIKAKLRLTRLSTTGGRVIRGLNKRPYPKGCEWCSLFTSRPLKPTRLVYHHWDDQRPSMGLWLCHRCHHIAELMDKPWSQTLMNGYIELKRQIEKAYATDTEPGTTTGY
ncbi:hypothetical protein ES703_54695 [subsurface metagenome]